MGLQAIFAVNTSSIESYKIVILDCPKSECKMVDEYFDVSGEEIADLDDTDLRVLVGLLCEAEVRRIGGDASCVLWGGDQDAPDGGFDVNMDMPPSDRLPSFMQAGRVGFQVKKPNMPPSAITPEMRPKGELRPAIIDLIGVKGAYIIVSSGSSTTDSALKKRVAAMREAAKAHDPNDDLHVDFLDQGRIATWVRNHPALILWVKSRIGNSYKGWRPYGMWAWLPEGGEDKFLIEDQVRLIDDTGSDEEGMSSMDGIARLRADLSIPRKAVRLAGLSGVGKTRLVQALFDEEVGEYPLDQSLAFYADVSEAPSPDAQAMVDQLAAQNIRAIVVLDNCPPELHRQTARSCANIGSQVSMISVEYDVREDLPLETNVYRLEAASDDLIARLVRLHHPHIGEVDADKIAEFSGGNARIADVLASTIKKGETLSGFKDEDLFKRLFQQRQDPNDELLTSAEALSIVYSFDGEATDAASELAVLGSLIGKDAKVLYRDVSILWDRQLVQARSNWRAVLPHAIANRLAANLLKKSPPNDVTNTIMNSGSERLVKSFSRRLSFLHDSLVAQKIVGSWLAPEGWLGEHDCNFNELGMSVFENIAPVCPEDALRAMERACEGSNADEFVSRSNSHRGKFVYLLRAIAFEPEFFERCVSILVPLALAEEADERTTNARSELEQMFRLQLSGTWASAEQREKMIVSLCDSDDPARRALGIELLDAALESWHFTSAHRFDFGARPRDYGYLPKTYGDVKVWFERFVRLIERYADPSHPLSGEMRQRLASRFRGLWSFALMHDELTRVATSLDAQKPWNEGWVAVRETRYFDYKEKKEPNLDDLARLNALEKILRPKNLIDLARIYAVSRGGYDLDTLDGEEEYEEDGRSRYERVDDITCKIGRDLAVEDEMLDELLPELLSTNAPRAWMIGKGLAQGEQDRDAIWAKVEAAAREVPEEERNVSVMLGFLGEVRKDDSARANAILNDLVSDADFAGIFPLFQIAAGVDDEGVERLKTSLENGVAGVWLFQRLAWGRAHESIKDDQLAELLELLVGKPEGHEVATEILRMRFHRDRTETGRRHKKSILEFGRKLLMAVPLSGTRRSGDLQDHELAGIACVVFRSKDTARAAQTFCKRLKNSEAAGDVHLYRLPELLAEIAKLHPVAFLDAFLDEDEETDLRRNRLFAFGLGRRESPLSAIPDEVIVKWCVKKNQALHFQAIASNAPMFHRPGGEDTPFEWKPLFRGLVASAPDKVDVLQRIAENIRPRSWSGSLHAALEDRAVLFEALREDDDPMIRDWARDRLTWIKDMSERQRRREEEERRDRDESFE
jgi:hypothetical protein